MNRFLKFCPKCGKDLPMIKGKYLCQSCGFLFYINPAPAVGGVILKNKANTENKNNIKNKKVLLTKRAKTPFKGYWDIPGGFMNSGEKPEETLKREIKEELSVEIIIGDLIGFFPDTYGKSGWPTLNIFYFCKIKKGKLKPATDINEAKWFELKNLPKKLAFKNTREVLKYIKN